MKERGITLVALVVTIILLLILTGVTLNIALSDNGLFEKTKEAVEKYEEAEDEEENAINKMKDKLEKLTIDYNDYVGCYVEGYKPDTKEITITSATSGVKSNKDKSGNIIADNITEVGDQTFKTETGMKWRIWDYDKNTNVVRLISNKPTDTKLSLQGAVGYNNVVWALNEICRKCYGQDIQDVNILNIRRSDILNVSTFDITNYSHNENGDKEATNGKYNYGSTMKCSTGKVYYPDMWNKNDRDWNYKIDTNGKIKGTDKLGLKLEYEEKDENSYIEGSNDIEFKQSICAHTFNEDDFKDSRYYEILFGFENGLRYFLAGRYVNLYRDNVVSFASMHVDVSDANSTNIGGATLFFSNKGEQLVSAKIRPIVSINLKTSGYILEKNEDSEGAVSFELRKKVES